MHLLDRAPGHVTRWRYNGRNRVDLKTYADGETIAFHYDGPLVALQTNERGQTVSFDHDSVGNLTQIFGASLTPTTFDYDKMNRLVEMRHKLDPSASTDVTIWTRNWLGEATDATVNVGGTVWQDVFLYDYDALGRQTGRTVNGATETSVIDDLDRLTSLTNPLGTFTVTYQSAVSQQLDTVGMTGGPSTTYGWHPSAQNQQLQEIWNKAPGGATLSKFNYEYNPDGQIQSWRREGLSAGEATEYKFNYDPAGQLLNAALRGVTSQTVSQSYGYGYDAAGNRTKEIVGTAFTAETPDASGLNQLAARSSGTVLPIRGTTNEPVSAVTINGQAAKISGGNRFEGTANVTAGNNTVTVAATDYGQPPNTTTKQYQVAVAPGANDSFGYDDSGNMLTGGGRTYEWDALDRLTAVTVGTQRTEFLYDGLGRRAKITEKTGGTVTSVKRLVYDGLDLAEERVDSTNALTKQFFGTGMKVIAGTDAGSYIYTRDHLGSIREVWKMESASLAARYDYDPYGRRIPLSNTGFDAEFGFTGHSTHLGTGLALTQFRAYDTNLGRWLSRDPLGEASGVDLYGYVLNDPINLWDPHGLEARVKFTTNTSNFFAGASDNLTLGVADTVRRKLGDALGLDNDDLVDKCSTAYTAGQWAGTGLSIATGAAGGLKAAGTKGAGKEFSHWIPNRFGGPRSPWNGNFVSPSRHYRHDPFRYPPGWRELGPRLNPFLQQVDRIPNAIKGTAAGIGYAAGSAAANNSKCSAQ